jgi:presenilin-like A22 family membrane protease
VRRYAPGLGIGIVGAAVIVGLASIVGWAFGVSSVVVLVSLGAFWIAYDRVSRLRRRTRTYGN